MVFHKVPNEILRSDTIFASTTNDHSMVFKVNKVCLVRIHDVGC